jgi:hypothetical protein
MPHTMRRILRFPSTDMIRSMKTNRFTVFYVVSYFRVAPNGSGFPVNASLAYQKS